VSRGGRWADRSRFTDTEWALYGRGRCCYQTGYGLPWSQWCGKPSKPGHRFGYCHQHARSGR
jgi:hypothetical protein